MRLRQNIIKRGNDTRHMQGSVIGAQQHYLERMEGPMHREGFAFRQRVSASAGYYIPRVSPAHVDDCERGLIKLTIFPFFPLHQE